MPSDRRGLIWILLATAALLLLIAIGAVLAFLVLRQRPVTAAKGWQDPIAAIAPDKIAPDLALYPLAGALESETIDAALDNDELHTAYAALTLAFDLRDEQRSGRLLQLGSRFSAAQEPDMARLAYQQVYDLAILSPEMNDPLRTDALLADGKNWAELGHEEEAGRAYDQVYTIAVKSPYLQVAYRRDLLTRLATVYADLGQTDRADLCRQQIATLTQGSQPQLSGPVGQAMELLANPLTQVSSAEIGALEENRRQAAYSVLQAAAGGAAPPSDLINNLAQALKAEDQAKLAFYQQEREATTQPSRRVNVDWSLIDWLMLKYKVALRGFGLSIVPEWEQQAAAVQSELSKAYESLRFDYEDLVTSLPDAALMEPGRYGVRRMLILAGRLGQYPNYAEQQLADKLQEAARNMIIAGMVEPLYVDIQSDKTGLWFLLSPADQYGSQ
ncbi:MAG: hypothetical protein JXM73_07015 [Anaerolineae bacterium]|nr:hypothetical protein [Anaerolineae bacterium]